MNAVLIALELDYHHLSTSYLPAGGVRVDWRKGPSVKIVELVVVFQVQRRRGRRAVRKAVEGDEVPRARRIAPVRPVRKKLGEGAIRRERGETLY